MENRWPFYGCKDVKCEILATSGEVFLVTSYIVVPCTFQSVSNIMFNDLFRVKKEGNILHFNDST